MKLDELPVEILMQIFRYLPAYGEAAVVNKLFYHIACTVNDSNICLRIDGQFYERFLSNNETSSRWLQSIQQSNRAISRVQIADVPLSPSVVGTFASTVKSLQLEYDVMDESTLLEILSVTPNVERLDIHSFSFKADGRSTNRFIDCNGDLNLKKLKSLSINEFSSVADEVFNPRNGIFNRLPVGVLSELQIYCHHWDTLATAFNRQFNIKSLSLSVIAMSQSDELAAGIFDNLQLESLELGLYNVKSVVAANILSKQITLKSLTLHDATVSELVDEVVMVAVANLNKLEKLTITTMRIPAAFFLQIRKLTKLQEFNLRCCAINSTSFETLVESEKPAIDRLSLTFSVPVTVDLIAGLAKSSPQLKHFDVQISNSMELTDAFMRHFNFVEIFNISICNGPLGDPAAYFNQTLRELSILSEGFLDDNLCLKLWLPILPAAYPNLKKLKLISNFSNFPLEILTIMSGFDKLESLIMRGIQPAVVEDLLNLWDRRGSLKFVSLDFNGRNELIDMLAMKLRYDCGLICECSDGILNVAVDRYTLNCELSV